MNLSLLKLHVAGPLLVRLSNRTYVSRDFIIEAHSR